MHVKGKKHRRIIIIHDGLSRTGGRCVYCYIVINKLLNTSFRHQILGCLNLKKGHLKFQTKILIIGIPCAELSLLSDTRVPLGYNLSVCNAPKAVSRTRQPADN